MRKQTAIADDTLPTGQKIKAGVTKFKQIKLVHSFSTFFFSKLEKSIVAWSAYVMGRSEEYWDKPLEFRPERFLGENGGKEISPWQFVP